MDDAVLGLVLAGGLSRRMGGGDKGLLGLAGRPILAHVVERIRPQVARLIVNANGEPTRFRNYDLPVVADLVDGFAGPLAGVLTGLDWAAANARECDWVVSVACDAPFLPDDLVARLVAAVEDEGAEMACAASGGRSHPVFGLWPVRLRHALHRAMTEERVRKVDVWTARYRLTTVDFPIGAVDPFFNANRPEDLAEAERLLAAAG